MKTNVLSLLGFCLAMIAGQRCSSVDELNNSTYPSSYKQIHHELVQGERTAVGPIRLVVETDTWLQFGPYICVEDYLSPAEITANMDAAAVLCEVFRIDEQLSELYREVVKRGHSKRIKEIFANLLETNEKEMRNLSHDFGQMRDW